jgi:hypothetical protein
VDAAPALVVDAESVPEELGDVVGPDGEYAGVSGVLDADEQEPLAAPNTSATATKPPSTSASPMPLLDEVLVLAVSRTTCGAPGDGLLSVE